MIEYSLNKEQYRNGVKQHYKKRLWFIPCIIIGMFVIDIVFWFLGLLWYPPLTEINGVSTKLPNAQTMFAIFFLFVSVISIPVYIGILNNCTDRDVRAFKRKYQEEQAVYNIEFISDGFKITTNIGDVTVFKFNEIKRLMLLNGYFAFRSLFYWHIIAYNNDTIQLLEAIKQSKAK